MVESSICNFCILNNALQTQICSPRFLLTHVSYSEGAGRAIHSHRDGSSGGSGSLEVLLAALGDVDNASLSGSDEHLAVVALALLGTANKQTMTNKQ